MIKWWPAVLAYLLCIVLANVLVASLGWVGMVVASVLLLPFDMTLKDHLQERWHGRSLLPRMATLIFVGSVASAVIAPSTATVATGSFVAFACGSFVDTLVFEFGRDRMSRQHRSIASNVACAVVDTVVFQLIVFSVVTPEMVVAQIVMKAFGGVVWPMILARTVWR